MDALGKQRPTNFPQGHLVFRRPVPDLQDVVGGFGVERQELQAGEAGRGLRNNSRAQTAGARLHHLEQLQQESPVFCIISDISYRTHVMGLSKSQTQVLVSPRTATLPSSLVCDNMQ